MMCDVVFECVNGKAFDLLPQAFFMLWGINVILLTFFGTLVEPLTPGEQPTSGPVIFLSAIILGVAVTGLEWLVVSLALQYPVPVAIAAGFVFLSVLLRWFGKKIRRR